MDVLYFLNFRLAMSTRKGVYVFDLIPDPSFKSPGKAIVTIL